MLNRIFSETNYGLRYQHTESGNPTTLLTVDGEVFSKADIDVDGNVYNTTDGSDAAITGPGPEQDEITHAALANGTNDYWAVDDYANIDTVKRIVKDQIYKAKANSLKWKLVSGDAANTVTLTILVSNDSRANENSDDYWTDYTNDLLGAVSKSANNGTEESLKDIGEIPFLKVCFKLVFSNEADAAYDNSAELELQSVRKD